MGLTILLAVAVALGAECKDPCEALARIRALRASGERAAHETAVIDVAPGVYRLSETLRLGPDDSNVVFRGPADGTAVFSGLRTLGSFTADAAGVWHLKVAGGLEYDQLFVNGKRATVARSPNVGYHYMRETVYEWTGRDGRRKSAEKTAFLADDAADVAALAAEPLEEIQRSRAHVFFAWDSDFIRVADVDAKTGIVVLQHPEKLDFFRWPNYQTRYVLENYRGALDEPGEWFFDETSREILYLPRQGERVETAVASVPVLGSLVEICGRPDRRVSGVAFERIGFEGCGWKFPKAYQASQAAYKLGAAVTAGFADGVRFSDCRFGGTATYALNFQRAVTGSSVRRCVFDDLGAGGVRIGMGTVADGEVCERITVDDNVFLRGGRIFSDGVAILLVTARKCELTHNEIRDFYYSGISAGWTWGYADTVVRDNLIGWNRIRDIGQGVLSDMAGIYTLGRSDGTRIVGNDIRDVFSYDYTGGGAEGIYMDEGSQFIVIESNLVWRTKGASFNQNYGADVLVRNNIFYGAYDPTDGKTSAVTAGFTKGKDGKPRADRTVNSFSNNVIVAGVNAYLVSRTLPAADLPTRYKWGRNLYWSVDGRTATNRFARGTMTFDAWKSGGHDAGSAFADPLFADAANGDFRLRPDSPAFGLGFREWDLSKAGARTPALRAMAENHRTPPLWIPPTPKRYFGPTRFETGFEVCKTGGRPAGFQSEGDEIVVTEETARTGRKCVRIVDLAKKQHRSYLPHLPTCLSTQGTDSFALAFSVKFDAASGCYFEFRENSPNAANGRYATLSHLSLSEGRAKLHRQAGALDALKPGVWHDVRWVFRFAPEGTTYDLTVRSEDGTKVDLKGLPSLERGTWRPNWFGFMSSAHAGGTLYLDDFKFGPVNVEK